MKTTLANFMAIAFIPVLSGIFVFYYFYQKSLSVAMSKYDYPALDNPIAPNNNFLTNVQRAEIKQVINNPLENAQNRITKKPFGIKVSPQNSPVQPERFSGFHTGADFEVTPEEINKEMVVKSICDGQILAVQRVTGYGGVIVESCIINNQPATVLYGHLNLAGDVKVSIGDKVTQGQAIGVLGNDKSYQTDGERKHLHLSIHKGTNIDYRGYVQNPSELDSFLDPAQVLGIKERV